MLSFSVLQRKYWRKILILVRNTLQKSSVSKCLVVSKSQKHFFLKLHSIAQKTNEILDKILPYEARAEFCQIFRQITYI